MPLLASQARVIRDPSFRQRWPEAAQTFVQVDELMRTRGDTCPRVAAIWDMLMVRAKLDTETWDWFSRSFPGVPMVAGGGSYQRPPDGSRIAVAMPPIARAASPVNRAIETIKSFRRT